jgi:hypothetical protein
MSVIAITCSKKALLLISLIVVITMIDSQFINLFYGTDFGIPSNSHLLLFISFVIVASIINAMLLLFVKSKDIQATTTRPLLFKITYIGTSVIQYALLLIVLIVILEMLNFHQYNKTLSLLVLYFSHFWSAFVLGILSFMFIQWLRFTRSLSILIYAVVIIVILFLILITIPLLTEQFTNQPESIYPRDYTSLIMAVTPPSRDIAFIYGLGNYVLPLMIISSWFLTVSLLKSYAKRIGKKTFWFFVSIPLLYELFSFVVIDSNLITDPSLTEFIYSKPFQFLLGISYQVTGLVFAMAFLVIARKMKQNNMKIYLIISSIGVASLFSSMQPGTPFFAAYPPFGLVTVLFSGLSSYMLLVGILGCAAYVSRDSELRREVHKGIVSDSDVMKMGRAEMQREIENRVRTTLDKVKLSNEVKYFTPDEEDVKVMIEDVLNEVHSKRSHDKSVKE